MPWSFILRSTTYYVPRTKPGESVYVVRRTWYEFYRINTMTSVYRASDSMSTRPRISAPRMAATAPGFRAIASAADAVALPCPRPHRPDAIAIANPPSAGFQAVPMETAAALSAANMGTDATKNTASSTHNILNTDFIDLSPFTIERE